MAVPEYERDVETLWARLQWAKFVWYKTDRRIRGCQWVAGLWWLTSIPAAVWLPWWLAVLIVFPPLLAAEGYIVYRKYRASRGDDPETAYYAAWSEWVDRSFEIMWSGLNEDLERGPRVLPDPEQPDSRFGG